MNVRVWATPIRENLWNYFERLRTFDNPSGGTQESQVLSYHAGYYRGFSEVDLQRSPVGLQGSQTSSIDISVHDYALCIRPTSRCPNTT
eukprot:1352492-Amorphochlora_amoeboformis.AAC.2